MIAKIKVKSDGFSTCNLKKKDRRVKRIESETKTHDRISLNLLNPFARVLTTFREIKDGIKRIGKHPPSDLSPKDKSP